MSVSRPARCLFCSFSRTTLPRLPRRQFHSTPTRYAEKKPSNNDVNLPRFGRWTTGSKAYTENEKTQMKKEYTKEQIAVIEAGEHANDQKDMTDQHLKRDDPWALKYVDDFSTIEPVVDRHTRSPETTFDPNIRFKNDDELAEDLAHYILNMPEEPETEGYNRYVDSLRLTVGKEEAELNPTSSVVPDIVDPGETLDAIGQYTPVGSEKVVVKKDLEATEAMKRLMQVTGYDQKTINTLRVKTLISHSVVNQTRLGKIRKRYVLSVAGNGKGLLGIGEGKSDTPNDARMQSQYRAIRNMQPIKRYEGRTIFGDVKGKVAGTDVVLMHRPPGFGLRCQHLIWEMCRAAGIQDMAARVGRSQNKMNAVKAAYQALMSQKDPEDIARARGKKLVDVRKVYYAGMV